MPLNRLDPAHKDRMLILLEEAHNFDLDKVSQALDSGNENVALAYLESVIEFRAAIDKVKEFY